MKGMANVVKVSETLVGRQGKRDPKERKESGQGNSIEENEKQRGKLTSEHKNPFDNYV